MNKKNIIGFFIAVTLAGVLVNGAKAQNLIIANPAEDTDFKSLFVNPAILSFHQSHLAVGGKLFHLGFVDNQSSPFRQGFVSLALPFGLTSQMGLGIQGQYFNTPLFSQSDISFLLSRRFKHNMALGLKFNIFSKSFNQNNFDLVDPDDPVFRNGTSLWAATFGVGFFMYPLSNLSIGVGIDHINRANISLNNDNVYQPLKGYIGAVLQYGLLRAAFSASYEEGRWLPRTTIGTGMTNLGYLMLGYNQRAFEAEAQLKVTGPLSINYRYEYTLFDNEGIGQGSHQVSLIHEFGHKKHLPKFEVPDQLLLEFQPPDKTYVQETKFYIYPTVESLDIIEKRLTRKIDPGLDPRAVAQLSEFDVGILDGSRDEKTLPFKKQPVDVGRIPARVEANLTPQYDAFLRDTAQRQQDSTATHTNIITPKNAYLRAAGLKKYFLNDSLTARNLTFIEPKYESYEDSLRASRKIIGGDIQNTEHLKSLSAPSTTFEIIPVSQVTPPRQWQLLVQNSRKETIRTFTGAGMPDVAVQWDWRDESGQLIVPGMYGYFLEWQDSQRNWHQTEERFISVQKIVRHITIEITNKQKDIGEHADEIDIILKK